MNFLRKHWYDLGGVLAVVVLCHVLANRADFSSYQLLLWTSLITLFLHQLEEYRIVGTFPGMVNKVVYKSAAPDRYPLNTNTAFWVNVGIGWTTYFLAAILAERAVWLGIATLLVSLGNVMAHTVFFNLKGKTFYNAGLFTSWLLFMPCIGWAAYILHTTHLAITTDYLAGIALGIVLNVVGILKLIDWMADRNTSYVFEQRNLLPESREKEIR